MLSRQLCCRLHLLYVSCSSVCLSAYLQRGIEKMQSVLDEPRNNGIDVVPQQKKLTLIWVLPPFGIVPLWGGISGEEFSIETSTAWVTLQSYQIQPYNMCQGRLPQGQILPQPKGPGFLAPNFSHSRCPRSNDTLYNYTAIKIKCADQRRIFYGRAVDPIPILSSKGRDPQNSNCLTHFHGKPLLTQSYYKFGQMVNPKCALVTPPPPRSSDLHNPNIFTRAYAITETLFYEL